MFREPTQVHGKVLSVSQKKLRPDLWQVQIVYPFRAYGKVYPKKAWVFLPFFPRIGQEVSACLLAEFV